MKIEHIILKKNSDGQVAGYLINNNKYIPVAENSEEYTIVLEYLKNNSLDENVLNLENAKLIFKQNRETILNSISWMSDRNERESKLVSLSLLDKSRWTSDESKQYYIYCQALADRPSLITDWGMISYPTVPVHIFNDMDSNIKQLCKQLKCDPI